MIVILGAGPAGLSASAHLSREHVVLEKGDRSGGLCQSFDLGGATFDIGGHAYFTHHDEVNDLVEQWCAEGVYRQPRRAFIHSHETYVPYPFQGNLFGLPTEVVEDCLVGLIEAVRDFDGRPPATVADWIKQTFGDGIARHFLNPYNEKIWAHPLNEISPEWSSERIIRPDPRAIVAGALSRIDFVDFPNAQVGYPATGGFERLFGGAADTAPIETGHEIAELDLDRQSVTTSEGERFEFEHLISTIPLDELVRRTRNAPSCCSSAAERLGYFSLTLVNLVVGRNQVTSKQRIYSADPDVPFHKLVLNSNSSESLRSRPVFGIQGEVSHSAYKPVDRSSLIDRTVESLVRIGLLEPNDSVVDSSLVDVERAYPVYHADTNAARDHLLEHYSESNVLCAGRFGEWLYINSDRAVMRGRERALQIQR